MEIYTPLDVTLDLFVVFGTDQAFVVLILEQMANVKRVTEEWINLREELRPHLEPKELALIKNLEIDPLDHPCKLVLCARCRVDIFLDEDILF